MTCCSLHPRQKESSSTPRPARCLSHRMAGSICSLAQSGSLPHQTAQPKAARAQWPPPQGSICPCPREPAQAVAWDGRAFCWADMQASSFSATESTPPQNLCVIWTKQQWVLARLNQQGWRKSRCAELIYTACWYSPKLLAIKSLSHSWLKDKLLTVWKCCSKS